MIVLRATQQQYDALNNWTDGIHKIEFQKDANDYWVIGSAVLNDPSFAGISNDLQLLTPINYDAPVLAEIN